MLHCKHAAHVAANPSFITSWKLNHDGFSQHSFHLLYIHLLHVVPAYLLRTPCVVVKTQGGKKPLVKSSSSALLCSVSVINIEFHLQLKCANKEHTKATPVNQESSVACIWSWVSRFPITWSEIWGFPQYTFVPIKRCNTSYTVGYSFHWIQ